MFRTVLTVTSLLLTAPAFAETIRFAVTDIDGMETMQQEFGAFEAALEEATGYDVELLAVSSRTAAVEAINQKQVDLILTGPAEYVVIKALTNPEIVAAWQRPNYFAQIVALAKSDIRSVKDLKGKRVTFGAVGSTSQHLGPAQVLTDLGLVYGNDYQPEIINRNVAVEALVRGDVAAVGMNETHLRSIREAFPDQAFTVLARGRDLPNDVLVARAGIDAAMLANLRDAFQTKGETLMSAILQGDDNKKYQGGFFLTDISDADYDYVRSMYATVGVDTEQFIQ
ncbi:phosphonate transport system substrate-binding protein [Sulfitobacter undariae]|uniref:Phosphonate transport system substrate-binding protein n=1 Tax=Sulfitobacter undariae TaxID=1563671 RepID=A0A7W6H2C0_9RHOB|nr:PhnD/SsuA/transferrin family substrate-binding protein [Sulfitobacter undariae]MBB3995942.1 phosphonate transport system substrate-binding protein [Sulfitobacter undariae]